MRDALARFVSAINARASAHLLFIRERPPQAEFPPTRGRGGPACSAPPAAGRASGGAPAEPDHPRAARPAAPPAWCPRASPPERRVCKRNACQLPGGSGGAVGPGAGRRAAGAGPVGREGGAGGAGGGRGGPGNGGGGGAAGEWGAALQRERPGPAACRAGRSRRGGVTACSRPSSGSTALGLDRRNIICTSVDNSGNA